MATIVSVAAEEDLVEGGVVEEGGPEVEVASQAGCPKNHRI